MIEFYMLCKNNSREKKENRTVAMNTESYSFLYSLTVVKYSKYTI